MDDQPKDLRSQPSPKFKAMASKKQLILIGAAVVLILAGGIYLWKHGSQTKTATPATSNWTQYTDTKYGLKFEYLKTWGAPKIFEYKGLTGTRYELSFKTAATQKYTVTGAFSSADETSSGCNGACGTLKAYTKDSVKSDLSKDKASYVKYDDTSYATLFTDPENKIAGELYVYQTINLSKVNSSAIQIAYTKLGENTCASDKLAAATDSNCINENTYKDVNRFAKSIQNL